LFSGEKGGERLFAVKTEEVSIISNPVPPFLSASCNLKEVSIIWAGELTCG